MTYQVGKSGEWKEFLSGETILQLFKLSHQARKYQRRWNENVIISLLVESTTILEKVFERKDEKLS